MEVVISGRLYLQHPENELLRVKLPAHATAQQLAVSTKRLQWLKDHPGCAYPDELSAEITAQRLWNPNNKVQLPKPQQAPAVAPTAQAHTPHIPLAGHSLPQSAVEETSQSDANDDFEPLILDEVFDSQPATTPTEPLSFQTAPVPNASPVQQAPLAQVASPVGVPSALEDEEVEWQVLDEDEFHERFRQSSLDGLGQDVS